LNRLKAGLRLADPGFIPGRGCQQILIANFNLAMTNDELHLDSEFRIHNLDFSF
jgi:hypothetical protein